MWLLEKKQNQIKCGRRVKLDVVTPHTVSQVNEIKNTNGILLRAYTE